MVEKKEDDLSNTEILNEYLLEYINHVNILF